MSGHLRDHEVSAAVAGLELGAAAQQHLAGCLSCRRLVAEMTELIEVRRRVVEAEAPDWEAQRAAIMGRLGGSAADSPRRRRWLRPLLAAAAVLLAAGIGLHRLPPGGGEPAEIPLESILAEVDATLAADTVPGFEGLDPIVPDMDEIREHFSNGAS